MWVVGGVWAYDLQSVNARACTRTQSSRNRHISPDAAGRARPSHFRDVAEECAIAITIMFHDRCLAVWERRNQNFHIPCPHPS